MKKTFNKSFMLKNKGCYSELQLEKLMDGKDKIFLSKILKSDISIKDKYWFVCKKLATKEQNQRIAIGVANIVLKIYEHKHPDDKRPREAIQAAEGYLAGKVNIKTLREKRNAAAAYADADAAAAAAKLEVLNFLKEFCN